MLNIIYIQGRLSRKLHFYLTFVWLSRAVLPETLLEIKHPDDIPFTKYHEGVKETKLSIFVRAERLSGVATIS